jgi:hypothetical protein
VKLAVADDTLDAERREELREAWLFHLDGLSESDADAASFRVETFIRFLNGLLRAESVESDASLVQEDGDAQDARE